MDVLTTFEFLFTISRTFGIFPFRIQKLTRVSIFLDTKPLGRIKVILVISMFVQGLIFFERIKEELKGLASLSKKLVNLLNLIVFTFGMFVMYTRVITKTNVLRHWLNKMNNLCLLLKPNHSRLRMRNRVLILLSYFNYFFGNGPGLIQYWLTIEEIDIYEFFDSLYFFIALGVANLFTCQFLIFTNAVRFIYVQINDGLMIWCHQSESVKNKALKLKNLKAEDMFLKDCIDAINSVYMFHTFVCIFWSFLSLLYVAVDEIGFDSPLPATLHILLWTSYLFFQMVLILVVCQTTAAEAEKTAHYVHQFFLDNDDPEIKEEVEIFSLQLQHRKVEFNACGFFKLDFTLLYSMIGAVTTYVIILMQFQKEDPTSAEWQMKKNVNCSILLKQYYVADLHRCLNTFDTTVLHQ